MVHSENPVSWRRDLLLLTVCFALLYGFRLGSAALSNPDDGRYAEIPREMIATHDWVTPRLNGVNYFEKPPLMYWSVAVGLKLFGASEWSARLMPALYALAGVLLTYAAGRKLYGRDAGIWSAAVLGTSLLYFIIAHTILLDMAVSVLMSATLFCFIVAVGEPPGKTRGWIFHGVYATAALATLTKGLIGFLVTGAVMFLWLLIFNQWKRLRPMYLPSGIALFLAIAAPWHIVAALRNETWAHRYFYFEHWQRFSSPVADRPGAWYYYIGIILAGLIPWVGFLVPAVRERLRGGWAARSGNGTAWFLVTWILFIFLFFTKSHSKLPPYILPVFPALAVIIGAWLAEVIRAGHARPMTMGLRVFSFACGLLGVALSLVVVRPVLIKMAPDRAQLLQSAAFTMTAVLLVGGIAAPWLARFRGPRAAVTAILAMIVLFFSALQYVDPNVIKPGTKELALKVKAEAKPGDRVLHYHEFFHDFTFYAARLVDVVDFKGELELEEDAAARASGRFIDEARFREQWNGPVRFWVVARQRDVKALFADASFRYHLLAQSPDHYLFSNQP